MTDQVRDEGAGGLCVCLYFHSYGVIWDLRFTIYDLRGGGSCGGFEGGVAGGEGAGLAVAVED